MAGTEPTPEDIELAPRTCAPIAKKKAGWPKRGACSGCHTRLGDETRREVEQIAEQLITLAGRTVF